MTLHRRTPKRKNDSVRLFLQALEDRSVPAGLGWYDLATIPPSTSGTTNHLNLSAERALAIDSSALRAELAAAPAETSVWFGQSAGLQITLPRPDGTTATFAVADSPIMEPGLAAQFPNIKTYSGSGIDVRGETMRMDVTPQGFHAMVTAPSGEMWYIDPFYHLEDDYYVSYLGRDLIASNTGRGNGGGSDIASSAGDSVAGRGPGGSVGGFSGGGPSARSGQQLRTYRLAMAATGEYTQFQGGTVAAGQAAIVTLVNRLDQVYEQDFTIRMVLVNNNSNLVYTNGNSDPYTNSDIAAMLDENQQNVDSVIGNANYDIGHVVSTYPGGGLAALASVGISGRKASAATGLPSPTGDDFVIDYVAHEIGHQFGANHTFNTSNDSNRNAATAYEPGSGSTIMSYAGIEGSEDLQPHSDPFFHSVSFDEIIQYVDVTIPSVGSRTATGNSVPTVNAGIDYAIPANTPFELTASGTDANGDLLTYSWEERDLGPATLLTDPDNGQSPLFRFFPPTANPSRTFPRLSDLVNNSTSPGELLYTKGRTSDYRVTVRDNRAGGGGVNTDDMKLTVVDTGSAFAVVSPNSAVSWTGKTQQTVTWSVAGTNANGINTANVRIRLSTDGGLTYPITLLSSTANDGSEIITVPNLDTTQARIRVEAVGSVFFDISNANFTIVGVAGINVSPTSGLITTEAGGKATFSVVLEVAPTGPVSIPLVSSDTTEGTVSPSSLLFDTTNWSVPQVVTVTGVDDLLLDGDVVYTILTANASSSDTRYNNLNAADVMVTNINDDFAGFTVTPTSTQETTERGGTATFTVVLASQPTSQVQLPISSSNTAEGTVNKSTLTFLPATWNIPQTVTVTGVDDAVVDADIIYQIMFGQAITTDTVYKNLPPATPLALDNRNDDTRTFVTATGSNLRYGQATPFSTTITGLNGHPTGGTVMLSFGASTFGPFTVTNGVASGSATGLPIGVDNVVATFNGDAFYHTSVNSTNVTILPALLSVQALPRSKVYGAAVPILPYSPSGFVDGENSSILTGALATTATSSSGVGMYPISVGNLSAGSKYEIAFTADVLTVTAASLTIAATPINKVYGDLIPTLPFTPTGLVNNDTVSVIVGALSTTALASSSVGVYPIQKGTIDAGANYSVTYLGASLAVTPAALTVTPKAQTKQYGPAAVPALTFTNTGFVNGDTSALFTGGLITSALAQSPVGTYPILPGTLNAGTNYSLAVGAANVTITPAPLIVKANSVSSRLGAPIPSFDYTVTGLVNGDKSSVVSGVSLSSVATPTGTAGTYPIVVTGGVAGNYNVSPVNGVLTLTLSVALVGADHFTVGADKGGSQVITTYDANGNAINSFIPFPDFTGGIRTATGDVNGDGVPDIVAATGPGTIATVRVFDGATGGILLDLLPFDDFTGGAFVSLGDLSGDKKTELVISPDIGGGPRISIYSGGDFSKLLDFFGIDDINFRGGARTAMGDVNGDGFADLTIAAGFGGGPRISVLDGRQLSLKNIHGFLTPDFFAFAEGLRDGVYVTSGDVDGDGYAEIIVGAGPGGAPRVLVLSGKSLITDGPGIAGKNPIANFFSGDPDTRYGVVVSARNLDNDAYSDLVAGGGSLALAYHGRSLANGKPVPLFAVHEDTGPSGGVFVG